ncbi:metallophosphoesterase family protein [Magnetospira sp. QH-2]|uniref:metallophosphoesterase family protein n=1 Tax=Magnetospira sp. (strain QH-2) TaxID=1288970 RepID=UPI0003E81246|nr:metallophosphoesterase family protein [Magnetospira sp. QH-2]CCQ72879.1 putative serine/threonine protein phosphatase [Magnetospira sp. QH-2]
MVLKDLFNRFMSSATPAGKAPRVPDGTRVYAVGDIHGRSDLLLRLHGLIEEDLRAGGMERSVLIYLGDYVDRGFDSRGVLDLLLTPPPTTEVVYLKGNHEAMFLEFVENGEYGPPWFQYGGRETAESYGQALSPEAPMSDRFAILAENLRAVVPKEHLEFLHQLSPSHWLGDYFFAHAGVRPGVPLEEQQEHDLLWIRDPFLSGRGDFGAVVVHGHSITPEPDRRRNRIGIDTGAYGSNRLTCLVLDGDQQRFLNT